MRPAVKLVGPLVIIIILGPPAQSRNCRRKNSAKQKRQPRRENSAETSTRVLKNSVRTKFAVRQENLAEL